MKKFALILFLGVFIMCGFLALAVYGQNPVPEALPVAKTPASDVIVPILTTVAVVSEGLPLVNRKVHGIVHLLVAIFKLFRRK